MTETQRKITVYWLYSVIFMIFVMVVIGGITRLTHSGLSMVEWKPLMGALPPLSEEAWIQIFEKYKQFPEYQKVNYGMTLSEFKFIFFWEYFHRLWGRLIGLVYFLPFLILYFKKFFDKELTKKLLIGFGLGALQGGMGWFMVKSGLIDRPSVSHYRLAAHLALAFGICAYLYWVALDLIRGKSSKEKYQKSEFFKTTLWISAGIVIQILYGAFTAGLKAGFDYNTFPLMKGDIIPTEAFSFTPFIANFFENEPMVQFLHRTIAWVLLIGIHVFVFKARRANPTADQRKSQIFLSAFVGGQFLLGVVTLLLVVPVSLGVLHQAGAFLVLGSAIYANHVYAKP